MRTPKLPLVALFAVVPVLLASCSSDDSAAGPQGGGGGYVQDGSAGSSANEAGQDVLLTDVQTNGDGAAQGDAATDASADSSCGATAFAIEARLPNMLIVFDRSCSMRRQWASPTEFGTGPDDPSTRWFKAREALDLLTTSFQTRVRFGMMVFPRPKMGCDDAPVVNVAPDVLTKDAVLGVLQEPEVIPFTLCTPPSGSPPGEQPHVTPTAEALEAVIATKVLEDPLRENVVILMTDGGATCEATPDSLGALATQLLGAGVKTAVVGFGDTETAGAVDMLNAISLAGGMPRPNGPPHYWYAAQPADLQAALDTIVSASVSCTFSIKGTPPDSSKLYVFVDGTELPRNDPNGWTYDEAANTVTFAGSACAAIQSGTSKSINVVFGCPENLCTPQTEVCDGIDNDCDNVADEGCVK